MNRPKVVVFNSASADGRVALAADTLLLFGDERWTNVAGSSQDALDWLKLTYQPQATLEGSGSFVVDGQEPEALPPFEGDPAPLYEDFLPEHIVNRPGHRGWFTTVDGRGRIRWLYKEFPSEEWQGWHLLVLVARTTPPAYLAYLRREEIPYLVGGEGHVDLGCVLEKMAHRLGVTCLLSTAGGRLNGALLRAGLVDEVNIDLFPALIGGFQTSTLFASPDLRPDEAPARLRLLAAQVRDGGNVWLRYEVVPPVG